MEQGYAMSGSEKKAVWYQDHSPTLVLPSFIGLTVEATIGSIRYRSSKCLPLVIVPTQQTRGIGGNATVLAVQQVPIGVCGVPGLVTVQ
eukprot:2598354-Amphidinium_carterae.1